MDVDHERGVISTLQNTSTESSDVNLPRTSTEDLSVTVDSNQGADDYCVWEWFFDNTANVHVACDLRYFTQYTTIDDKRRSVVVASRRNLPRPLLVTELRRSC
ncbi:hypothetical protein PC116_g25210 [Phytophthora cactorum]|nr:hypothetical protein PC116_g25210 [Phytophthora cactorum]